MSRGRQLLEHRAHRRGQAAQVLELGLVRGELRLVGQPPRLGVPRDLDEGIVVRGGLPIAWREVSRVGVRRVRRGGRGVAGAATGAMMRADGVSDVWTTLALDLPDWPTIEARATTRSMAATLTRPLAGLTASATISLGMLPEPDVQQLLAAIVQQAQRHGIEVTTL